MPENYKNTRMGEIIGIHKFVVDGEYAEKLYEVFKTSYLAENNCIWQPYEGCSFQVDFSYQDGVFRVEERTTYQMSYIAEIVYFFADSGHIYSLSEHIRDGVVQSYDVCDSEGKYFVRPPKTEWELEMEQRRTQISDDDLPF